MQFIQQNIFFLKKFPFVIRMYFDKPSEMLTSMKVLIFNFLANYPMNSHYSLLSFLSVNTIGILLKYHQHNTHIYQQDNNIHKYMQFYNKDNICTISYNFLQMNHKYFKLPIKFTVCS